MAFNLYHSTQKFNQAELRISQANSEDEEEL